MADNGTTVRIVRHVRNRGVIINTELAGGWIVRPEEWPTSPKAQLILRTLKDCREEEPGCGWTLEGRGTERGWHEMEQYAEVSR